MKKFLVETHSRIYEIERYEVKNILRKHLADECMAFLADDHIIKLNEDGSATVTTVDSSKSEEKEI